jgi:predicted SnoaL-like aldol condensation-catalyzing enzyme
MREETAKTIVQHYFHQLLNQHDVSVCDELLAPEYVDHDAPAGMPPGSSSTKAFVTALINDYPDIQVRIVDMLAEANKVAARLICQGTHRQSRASLHQIGIVILRLNDQGQIAERWSAYTTVVNEQKAAAKDDVDRS